MKVKRHAGEGECVAVCDPDAGFLTVAHWHWWHHKALLSVDFGVQFQIGLTICYGTPSLEICSVSEHTDNACMSFPPYIRPYFTWWIGYETIEVLQTINTETEHVPWDDVSEVDKRWQRTCSCDRSPPPRQHPPPSPALPVPMRPTPVLWHWTSRKPSTGEHR